MSRYLVINTFTGELEATFESLEKAELECIKLNAKLPYASSESYNVFDEQSYDAWLGEVEAPEIVVWQVFGVSRKYDGSSMSELVMADTKSKAREVFEKEHPEFKSTDAWQVCV